MHRSWFLALLLIAGCSSTRPLAKIGLVAPFEGLYRHTGYEALAAVRLAIIDCAPPGLDVMPLALDDSNDPIQSRVAVSKLLMDPSVVGVIGPMNVAGVVSIADRLSASDVAWIVPWLLGPQMASANPAAPSDWLTPLLASAPLTDTTRIIIGGIPASLAGLVETTVLSVPVMLWSDVDPSTLVASDTVVWFGDAHAAAAYVTELAADAPMFRLVMAVPVGNTVFHGHTKRGIRQQVDWLIWLDSEYNQWMQDHASSTPIAYLHYRATCAMLAPVPLEPAAAENSSWRIRRYRTDAAGEWTAVDNMRP